MTTTTLYFRYANGSVGKMVTTADEVPTPEGAELITAEAHAAAVAAIDQANALHSAELAEQLQVQARVDYDALITLGMPDETARRLSGYAPPPVKAVSR